MTIISFQLPAIQLYKHILLKQNVSVEQRRTDPPFRTAAVCSAAGQCDVRLVYIIQFLPQWIYRLL